MHYRWTLPRLEKKHFFWLTAFVTVTVFFFLLGNWQGSIGVNTKMVPTATMSEPDSNQHVLQMLTLRPRTDSVLDHRPTEGHPEIMDIVPTEHFINHDSTSKQVVREEEEIIHMRSSSSSPTVQSVQAERDTNILWVMGNGSLVDRVQNYVKAISEERDNIVQHSLNLTKWVPPAGPIKAVWGNDVDTIYKLQNYSIVRTVALKWLDSDEAEQLLWNSMNDTRNLVVQDFYEWSGTVELCSWIRTQGHTKARWDAAYNRTCNTDANLSVTPRSLAKIYLHSKPINPSHYWPYDGTRYPDEYYTRLPKHVFYVHITRSAVVDGVGDVFTHNLKIVPYTCSHNPSPTPPQGFMDTPIFSEVFVITQFWGEAFFHKMTESIPRIAPYLEFLKSNPNILIHVAENRGLTAKILKLLGLNPTRLISGTCRAKVVYLPQGTYCGFPHVQEMQLLSHIYRAIIGETFPQSDRNSVVVIRRTGTRKFSQYSEIEDIVKTLSEEYGFTYEVYPDNPMLGFDEAMQMFNRALMVVGPHGAGLSNLLFCQPGTVVIEGVCNPPHVNMCYQRTAHILGHRYHGVPSRGGWTAVMGGCETVVDIHPPVIGEIVETHMKLLKRRQGTNMQT